MQLTPIASNMTEVETSEARILFSYRTPVAAYVYGDGFVRTEKWWSVTHITTHQQMVRWWDSKRSVTNLPRQLGLGGYNEYIKRNLSLHSYHHLIMNPQAHRSTEELKTIVKALSKLRILNTPEEDQRLFECEQELRKRKREDDFINAHFQVITYS